jgi:spore maturation protein CgeB
MNQPLKIAVFGSSLVSCYWNGAATYYRGILRALAARGHHIRFFEPDAFDRQKHRDMENPDWAEVTVYPPNPANDVLALVDHCRDCDVVIKASGVGVNDDLLDEAVLKLRANHRRVIYWDVDAPATLDSLRADPAPPLRDLIPRFDLILTYGGGNPVVQAYARFGARDCVPIYNAVDPHTHFPEAPDERFLADLAFLGNRLPDREERVDEFFLKVAAQLPNRRFLLAGNGWETKSMPSNVNYYGHLGSADHNAFNCTPRAVLNISRDSMANFGFSPATRVFEAAGAGACIITDAWEGIERFLEPGREILVARDANEVISHLEALTPARAKEIGKAARQRVLSAHTYDHRVEQLESLLTTVPPRPLVRS